MDTNDIIQEAKGTAYFMAPEAIGVGSSYYSGIKYDVWSLGVTLYCCTFNKLPFDI